MTNWDKKSRELHEELGVDWITKEPDESDREHHNCPECGRLYPTEAGQQDCLRNHSRLEADELAARAAGGEEVLPL